MAIEVVRGIYHQGAQGAFFATVAYIGRLTWLSDFQTLLTGAAAVAAAFVSVREVRRQIRKADQVARRQLQHEKDMEAARVSAKEVAARSVLPLALSDISDYSEACSRSLENVLSQCVNRRLPTTASIPAWPEFPMGAIDVLREVIEHSSGYSRQSCANLVGTLQVHRSRLHGLQRNVNKPGHITLSLNIERYIVDTAEIYAQASALYEYARRPELERPATVSFKDVGTALKLLSVDPLIEDQLVERYDLTSNSRWVPPLAR